MTSAGGRGPRTTNGRARAWAERQAQVPDDRLTGERIAYHRKRLGLSQVGFVRLVGRSESWVSQVELGVRPIDRRSVLQRAADVAVGVRRRTDHG